MGTLMVKRIGNGNNRNDEEIKDFESPQKSVGQNLNQTLDLSLFQDLRGFDDNSLMQIDSLYDCDE